MHAICTIHSDGSKTERMLDDQFCGRMTVESVDTLKSLDSGGTANYSDVCHSVILTIDDKKFIADADILVEAIRRTIGADSVDPWTKMPSQIRFGRPSSYPRYKAYSSDRYQDGEEF